MAEPGPDPLDLGPGTYAFCTCGRSKHAPFCDGAHLGTGMISAILVLKEPTTVQICACGRTGRPPFCDGSHSRLSCQEPSASRPWWKLWG